MQAGRFSSATIIILSESKRFLTSQLSKATYVSGNNPKKTHKLNRQERRAYEREQSKKTRRKIDWNKVKKSFITILLVGFSFTVLIFCFSYYVTTDQNSIRTSVAKEPQTTIAKVIFISGKGVRSAEYEYIINGGC